MTLKLAESSIQSNDPQLEFEHDDLQLFLIFEISKCQY
jgi:hypothetical protein